jgi:hypothetical protein
MDDAACPECGTPAKQSTGERSLLLADSSFLASLRLGITLIVAGFLVDVLWIISLPITFASVGTRLVPTMQSGVAITIAIDVVGAALSIAGWWLVTAKNPNLTEGERGPKRRVLMRWLVAILAVFSAGALVVHVVPSLARTELGAISGSITITNATKFTPLLITALSLRGFAMILKLARFCLGFYVLAQLAAEVPDAALAKRCRRGLWKFLAWAIPGSAIAVGPLIASVLYIRLLLALRKRLQKPVQNRDSETLAP